MLSGSFFFAVCKYSKTYILNKIVVTGVCCMKFVPQRALDTNEEHLQTLLKNNRLWAFIKHDGVRALNHKSKLLGKAMLPHANKYITKQLSEPYFSGLDGEIINTTVSGQPIDKLGFTYDTKKCLFKTTSMLNTINNKTDDWMWYLFDEYHPTLTYKYRYEQLMQTYRKVNKLTRHVEILPYAEVTSLEQILELEKQVLSNGFEGLIIRNPELPYKEGRSTKQGELLRLKRYITAEAYISMIEPVYVNNNPSKINALGLSERSSHIANKKAIEKIGAFVCMTSEDIYDPYDGTLLIKKHTEIVVSASTLLEPFKTQLYYMRYLLIGKPIKFKFFPKGIKDKPRYATFECFMSSADFSVGMF